VKVTRGALAAPAVTMVVALAGCGGSDGIDNARYVRDANRICAQTQAKAAAGGQPLSMFELKRRLQASHRALLTGARRLRALREQLAAEPSAKVKAFDRRVMPVVSMTMNLADDAEFVDGRAVGRHAEKLRRRSASLYEAAQAAGLQQCGRGGNRAADRALFVAYRVGYLEHRDEISLQTAVAGRRLSASDSPAEFIRNLDDYSHDVRSFRHNVARLTPPTDLRRMHRSLRRAIARILSSERHVRSVVQNIPSSSVGDVVASLHVAQADERRINHLDQRLRRLLTPKATRRGGRTVAGETV
jgi:hypothetical protein